jgi:hypothetical protein
MRPKKADASAELGRAAWLNNGPAAMFGLIAVVGKERDLVTSNMELPTGDVTAVFEYTHESTGYGGGGTGKLSINGTPAGEGKLAPVPPARYSATESFDVGMDLGEPVSTISLTLSLHREVKAGQGRTLAYGESRRT